MDRTRPHRPRQVVVRAAARAGAQSNPADARHLSRRPPRARGPERRCGASADRVYRGAACACAGVRCVRRVPRRASGRARGAARRAGRRWRVAGGPRTSRGGRWNRRRGRLAAAVHGRRRRALEAPDARGAARTRCGRGARRRAPVARDGCAARRDVTTPGRCALPRSDALGHPGSRRGGDGLTAADFRSAALRSGAGCTHASACASCRTATPRERVARTMERAPRLAGSERAWRYGRPSHLARVRVREGGAKVIRH